MVKTDFPRTAQLYSRVGLPLALASAFLLPFRLSLGYIPLIPLITLWLIKEHRDLPSRFRSLNKAHVPFVLLVIVTIISSLFGVNPGRSFSHVGSLLFFPFTILIFEDFAIEGQTTKIFMALFLGQAISGIEGIVESFYDPLYTRALIGKVSQSGQLALTIPVAAAFLLACDKAKETPQQSRLLYASFCGLINTALLILISFHSAFHLNGFTYILISVLVTSYVFAVWFFGKDTISSVITGKFHIAGFITLIVPMITAILIINLKRGPWTGIACATFLLLFLYRRRFLVPFVAIIITLIFSLGPVRDRLLSSEEHFFISGGRNTIWEIGGELSLRYPLGIGHENSGFLRDFSPEIPRELKHFHNNMLNVLVEMGWLGLIIYIWWIATLLKTAFTFRGATPKAFIIHGCGAAILSWQIAGLVQYNFGEAMVITIVYIIIGIMVGLTKINQESPNL